MLKTFNLFESSSNLYFKTFGNKFSFLHKYKAFNTYQLGQVIKVDYFLPSRDGLKLRSFIGVCIYFSKRGLQSSLLLRNSFRSNSIEQLFFIYSPLVLSFSFLYTYRKKNRLARLYFMRDLRQKNFALRK